MGRFGLFCLFSLMFFVAVDIFTQFFLIIIWGGLFICNIHGVLIKPFKNLIRLR